MFRTIARIGGGLLLLAVLAAGFALWRLAERGGAFATVEPVPVAGCRLIPGTVGGEDIEIDAATGWVFVSAHDRRALVKGEFPRGGIMAARLDRLDQGFTELTAPGSPDALEAFGPHGISLYRGPEGARLGVVNHRSPARSTLELYSIDYASDGSGDMKPSLRHLRTIEGPALTAPNEIVLTGPESFYVTNDHRFSGGWRETAETYLLLDMATLVHGEGDTLRVAASGFTYPNGVNVSPDGRTLYLSETTDGILRVYDRDPASGDLTQRAGKAGRMPVGRGPDNIEVTADGDLWIAAHPLPLKLTANGADAANPSPSAVMRLRVDDSGQPGEPETVYLDDGRQFSGSSVAVPADGRFLAGSVYGDQLLDCPFTR